jgi:threonyl-tRNA synthetase
MQKVPYLLVVGDREAANGHVNVRTRGQEKTEDLPAVEFVERIKKLIAEKATKL